MRFRKYFTKFYVLIGIFLFAYIVRNLDFKYYGQLLSSINFYAVGAANLLLLPVLFLKSYRWKKIMDIQNIRYSIKNAFLMYGASSLLGYVTPGRLGEVIKTNYLTKDYHPMGYALLNSFLDRIFDIAFLLLFICVSIIFVPIRQILSFQSGALGSRIFVLTSLIVVFVSIVFLATITKRFSRLKNVLREMLFSFKSFRPKDFLLIFIITTFSWLVYFLVIYFLAFASGISGKTSFFYLSFAAVLAGVVIILPISIFGVGTREAVLLLLLLPRGIPKMDVIVFSSLILFNYLFASLISLYCWFKKPIPI